MSDTSSERAKPSPEQQSEILLGQNNCCIYCERRFGSVVFRNGKMITLKPQWEHILAFAYSHDNRLSNFAAACQVCNGLKQDLIFHSLEEIKVYLLNKWSEKGFSDGG
jgi:5-methylcytosine-specific restriction endonuclease McrA